MFKYSLDARPSGLLHSNLMQQFLLQLSSHIQIPGANLGPAVGYLDSDLYLFSSVSLRKYLYRYRTSVRAMIFSCHKIKTHISLIPMQ
jgi:hypothetical protein